MNLAPITTARFGMALDPGTQGSLDSIEQRIQSSAQHYDQLTARLRDEIRALADEKFQTVLDSVRHGALAKEYFVSLATVLRDVKEEAVRRNEEAGRLFNSEEMQMELDAKAEETTRKLIIRLDKPDLNSIRPINALYYLNQLKELDFVVSPAVSGPLLERARQLMTECGPGYVQGVRVASLLIDDRRRNKPEGESPGVL